MPRPLTPGVSAPAPPKVIDARGTLNTDQWREAGWIIRALGCC
ncbi:hypothetical protein ACFVW5_02375 [Streptomyces sp. NPDC058232]